MPYPNDNQLNVIIAQTSASADGFGKFPFTERIISGSNLLILTDASGYLTGSNTLPSVTITNLTVTTLTASIISASTALTSAAATFTGPVSMSSTLSASGIYDSGILTVIGVTNLTNVTASGLTITGNSNLTTITGALSGSSVSTGNATINGGNINNTVIGGTTPAAGTFTNLTATGNTFLGDATSDLIVVTGSASISGSLSVVGSIIGTVETASKVLVTDIPTTSATYYVTFVSNTGSAQSINTDSNVLTWNPSANRMSLGPAASQFFMGSGNATIDMQTNTSTAAVTIGTSNSGSLVVGGNTTFKINALTHLFETDATSSFTNTENATSWTNGALTVAGGVGIGKNLHVSGSTFLYGDLTIYGSSSIVNISSSTIIIGDNRILLNAASPIMRYAGIDVYDSGSGGIQSNVTSSFLWDSLTDNWIIFSANSGSGTYTTASSIIIGGPLSQFGSETTLTTNVIPKVQSSGKNITNSLLSDNGTTLSYTGTGISASQITSSNALYTNVFSTNVSSSRITASNALLTNVYSNYISSSVISSSNLRVELTGSITYATGVLVTYITGSFNTLTLSTGSFPGNAPGLVPNTPTSSGMPGQINVDNNFIYVYTNQVWKRVPLSQWFN